MRQTKLETLLLSIMAIIAVLAMWTTGIVLLLGLAIRAI